MTTQELTGSDLREAVFEIVSRELGPAALVRYIAENFSQPERDYTEERRERPRESVQQIVDRIATLKAARGGSLAPGKKIKDSAHHNSVGQKGAKSSSSHQSENWTAVKKTAGTGELRIHKEVSIRDKDERERVEKSNSCTKSAKNRRH